MPLRALFTAGALVTAGMLAGRLLGLLREMLLASYFGTGSQADLAISLLIVPDLITSALMGSAVGATLVPLYAARSPEKAEALFWQALLASMLFFAGLAALVGINITSIGLLAAKDGSVIPGESAAFLLAVCSIPLTAATAITTSYLQYRGRVTVPAFANAIFNCGIILALWLMPAGLLMLGLGIVLAALVRFLSHLAAFFRAGGRWRRGAFAVWQIDRPLLKTYFTTALTDIFNMFPQFAPFVVIAAMGGGLAVFNYAFKLAFVPATLGYSITQMVLLPWFVKQLRSEGVDSSASYAPTLQIAWGVSLAVCLSLTLAARDIAELCFGYGKMSEADISQVGQLFAIGVWSMPGIFLSSIWQHILYAHGRPRMPLMSSMAMAALMAPLCWMGNLLLGLSGVLLAYAALQMLPMLMLSFAGYRHNLIAHYRPSLPYALMALAALAAWLPLSWAYAALGLSPFAGLLAAMAAGLIILAAGLAACPPVRQWGLKKAGGLKG